MLSVVDAHESTLHHSSEPKDHSVHVHPHALTARLNAWKPRSLVILLTMLLLVHSAVAQSLRSRVESIISNADIGKAQVGVSIIDVQSGSAILARNESDLFTPASNMKLLTSGAALLVLGPDYTFRTELHIDGSTLIVKGSGDPAFADPEILRHTEPSLTVDDFLNTLADAVIKHLPDGPSEIIVDDRVFDREYVHPTWDRDDLNKWYAPEVAGLNFHGNLMAVFAAPALDGVSGPPRVTMQPAAPWIGLTNRAKTLAKGSNTYWLSRAPTANTFTIYGGVHKPSPLPKNIPTHNNPLLFGQFLADRIMQKGVPVGQQQRSSLSPPSAVRLPEPDEALPEGALVAVVTTPIEEVLTRCDTDSINLYAEALLKKIGHVVTAEPGSWSNGSTVLRMVIAERLGSEAAAQTIIADGSGLSHENKVSPRILTSWLRSMALDKDLSKPYIDSLATPGRGTFTRRFRNATLHNTIAGKSGTLTGVRTLSGYVISDSGKMLAFSIMANDVPASKGSNASKMAERIVSEIDAYLDAIESTPAYGG